MDYTVMTISDFFKATRSGRGWQITTNYDHPNPPVQQFFVNGKQVVLVDDIDGTRPLSELQQDIREWSHEQFKRDSPHGAVAHLQEEARELLENPYSLEEFADCLILLLDAAGLAGYNANDLKHAAWSKLVENKSRSWSDTPNAHGYYKHTKG